MFKKENKEMKKDKNFTDENIEKEAYNKAEDGRIIKSPYDLESLNSIEKKQEKQEKSKDNLVDPEVDISEDEIEDLDNSSNDTSSDESQSSKDFLDEEDFDGDALNEGPDEDKLFHTGTDLDIEDDDLTPDNDYTSEDN